MDLLKIKRTYQSAKRLQEILNIFLKYGFGQLIDQIHLSKFIPLKRRLKVFGRWEVPTFSSQERLRMAFEEVGCTFIKLGQLLSSRPDIVGHQYAKEFKKLQDNVPSFSVEIVYKTVESELGKPVDEIFAYFNPEPIGSASIAQVHEAALKNNKKVIVKIRRPGIKDQILLDISIMQSLAKLIEKYVPESRIIDPTGVVEEFSKAILKELDFRREARNAMIFRKNFENYRKIYIPQVFVELTTERILVMEKVEGIRIDDIEALKEKNFDTEELINTVIDMYFKQIFEDGFFHGDPHPGNILVLDNGKIALVDFGIVGKIDEDFREAYANVALAIINQNIEQLIKEYLKLGIISKELDIDRVKKELKEDIEDILYPIYSFRVEEIKISEIIEAVMKAAYKHKLRFLPELLLINKVLIMLEGLTRELSPKKSIIELIKPYALKTLSEKLYPKMYLTKTIKLIRELKEAIENVPLQLQTLLKKAVRDDITVKMYHVNLPEFLRDIDKASNKIAFSLFVSAMILSSAIMHAAQVKPLVYGVSFFALITGIVAFFLGLWLIISIIKSGKL
ncbi:MAG: AarF/ABC1/UbiB kinase family protein [Thermodesulfovibrio sp.]|nr:AarF/ABC1/UbiB kinase family protein [Thermodesulfovibrio sp.]